jgi:hypothetical protein
MLWGIDTKARSAGSLGSFYGGGSSTEKPKSKKALVDRIAKK